MPKKVFDYEVYERRIRREDKYEKNYIAPRYNSAEGNKFVQQMLEAGLKPYHYNGRYYWRGPAVDVDDLQDCLGNTKIKCQWDSMGLGYVVYPRVPAERINKEEE